MTNALNVRRIAVLVSVSVLLVLVSACAGAQPTPEVVKETVVVEKEVEKQVTTVVEKEVEKKVVITATPEPIGGTVRHARATWDTGWFQDKIYQVLLEELGYTVEDPQTLDNPAAYLSIARGEVDFWANGWFPLHNTYVEGERVKGNVELVGFQVENGALQGYLVDKATVEEEGVDNLEDLQDPEVAALFDGNDNGTADLFGCPAGWGCELVIEHQLDAYELRDTVEHVQGAYAANMTEAIARYREGQSILFYTWTPNWTVNRLVPGEDVMWIGVPFPSLPEEQAALEPESTVAGVNGCVADPCPMGWPANDIRVVANNEFLAQNPAAERLFELVEIPLEDIAAQNSKMFEGEDTEEDIRRHAEEWIEANRDQVDQWLEEARAAHRGG